MIEPSIDKIMNIIDSKYSLVHVVSKRARQMYENNYYQMHDVEYKSKKNIGRALEETAEKLVSVKK